MTIDEVIRLLEISQPRELTPLQEKVLRLAWEGQTYGEMADALHYQDAYLKNIASGLWQELSHLFGEPMTKSNFALKLKTRPISKQQQQTLEVPTSSTPANPNISPESPYGPVPLNSDYYIDRPPMEELAFIEVHKPGGVIRLKAVSKMGKSSLLLRIMAQARAANYHTIQIDFKEAEQATFENLDRLLRWLCTVISRQLNLQPALNTYWDEETGSKVNCSYYLQYYLLPQLAHPLVISFNDIHHILAYPNLASEFLSLIRFWYEQAKQIEIWQKLRMILVHSTEIHVPLRLHESPFNVGLPITIPEFTLEQIQELAERHQLNWKNELGVKNTQSLMTLIGGHPYLVRLAFYYICWRGMSLETIISEAATPNGIYKEHLQNYSVLLQSYPNLLSFWLQVVTATEPVQLEAIIAYRLESLGLVKLTPQGVIPRCELYRQYFQKQLLSDNFIENQLRRLEEDNLRLQSLSYLDERTQTGSRRRFDQTLELEWRRMARSKSPLALILCEVDFFKSYDDGGEQQAGDCLRQAAQILKNCVQRASDLVARYGDREFGIILPETDVQGARQIAGRIQQSIKALGDEQTSPLITVSLGVACMIPETDTSIALLVYEVNKALYRSKQMGNNTITVSSFLDES